MSKSYGIEEARKILGDLVTAAQYGHPTTLTRNGKPIARIVPIEEHTMTKPVRVEIAQPFAGGDGTPTLDIDFPTTPGFRSGATISTQTAKELILTLEAKLEEIDAQR